MVDNQFFMTGKDFRIDLGCGAGKKEGFTGIDILSYPGVDFITDLEKDLSFLPDNSVEEFYSAHFLEHIVNFEGMMKEIHRTLKPGGKAEIVVPHFSNPFFYSDFTHKRFFGLYSFSYFSSDQKNMRRKVPCYNFPFEFEVTGILLVFKSPVSKLHHLFRKHVIQRIFNASRYMQELYEALYTRAFHCTEIRFTLRPVK